MSDFQLSSSFLQGGYRPPRAGLLGDYHLTLDPTLLQPQMGWCGYMPGGGLMPLGSLFAGLDDVLQPAMGDMTSALRLNTNLTPTQSARNSLLSAGSPLWDKLAGLIGKAGPGALWQPLGVPGATNLVTGKPFTIGTIDPAGHPRYDGVDGTVAGIALDSRWAGLSLGFGRRFRFATDLDVSVQLFADKDAVLNQKPQYLFSGGALSVKGRTSGGSDLSLRIGAGRDQAGGAAGFFTLQIGPDIPPAPVGP
ncbi:MAG: hypothetical protein JO055_16685 [Alphaproteobacteria bacterium]|nr:hypothetical protein [Alphaproteobacteria bacterium]